MKKDNKFRIIINITIMVSVAIVMLSGKVSYTLEGDTLVVGSFLSGKSKVEVQDIEKLELRNDFELGKRSFGISNLRISGGTFTNDEFGKYKLYKCNNVDKILIVHTEEGVIAFNLQTEEKTEAVYQELQGKLE